MQHLTQHASTLDHNGSWRRETPSTSHDEEVYPQAVVGSTGARPTASTFTIPAFFEPSSPTHQSLRSTAALGRRRWPTQRATAVWITGGVSRLAYLYPRNVLPSLLPLVGDHTSHTLTKGRGRSDTARFPIIIWHIPISTMLLTWCNTYGTHKAPRSLEGRRSVVPHSAAVENPISIFTISLTWCNDDNTHHRAQP